MKPSDLLGGSTESAITEEEHRRLLAQLRLAQLNEEQYLEFLASQDLELEDQIARAEENFRDYVDMMFPIVEAGLRMKRGWSTDAMCDHLQAVTEDHINNLVILVPPGMAKTHFTCVYWPTWEWGPRKMPHLRYISASYSEDLTLGSNRIARALIDAETYVKAWRTKPDGSLLWGIDPHQDSKTEYVTTKGGFRFATSTGGTITGRRGHRLLFDDLHSASQAESDQIRSGQVTWFRESAQNRIVDSKTKRILIMQSLHSKDVASVARELGWTVLCLPMRYEADHPQRWVGGPLYEEISGGRKRLIQWGRGDPRTEEGELLFPERFDEETVADLEEAMGDYAVAGQFQQRPTPRGGGVAKVDRILEIPWFEVPADIRKRRGWDFAGSKKKGSAFTAQALLGSSATTNLVYIFELWMDRLSPDELEQEVVDRAKTDGISVHHSFPKDPAQAGLFQATVLAKKLAGYTFEFSPESGSKEDRFGPFASQVNSGNVRFVIDPRRTDPRRDWIRYPSMTKGVASVREQLGTFPSGKYRDIPDAISRAYMSLVMAQDYQPPLLVEGSTQVIEYDLKLDRPYRVR